MAVVSDFSPSPGAPDTGATRAMAGPAGAEGRAAVVVVPPAEGAAAGAEAVTGGALLRPPRLAESFEALLAAMRLIEALSTALQGSLPRRVSMISSPETRVTRPPFESDTSQM